MHNRRGAILPPKRIELPSYRDPSSLKPRDVCSTCKRELTIFLFACDSHAMKTWHCQEHGDVIPMRSHIANF